MRMILILAALILLFALLVRIMPAEWAVPLYVLFVVIAVAYTGWERRRIGKRREQLQRELQKERLDFGKRQKQQGRQQKPND